MFCLLLETNLVFIYIENSDLYESEAGCSSEFELTPLDWGSITCINQILFHLSLLISLTFYSKFHTFLKLEIVVPSVGLMSKLLIPSPPKLQRILSPEPYIQRKGHFVIWVATNVYLDFMNYKEHNCSV